jgi:hypothetical protein
MLDRLVFVQRRNARPIVKLDDSALRINDNHERRAASQVCPNLIVDVRAPIVGRKDLGRDIWRQRRNFELRIGEWAQSFIGHVCNVSGKTIS